MPDIIIIGFEYTHKPLPGTIIDIFNVYQWCKPFCKNINIITDISNLKNMHNINCAIADKFVTKDIIKFIANMNSRSINKFLANTSTDLSLTIIKILSSPILDNKLIIYYTGHGNQDSIILPDKSLLSFKEFRDIIINLTSPMLEIFWIMDCCNPNGLYLPFTLEKNIFRLSKHKIHYVRQKILLITSSNNQEKSLASNYGSVFSRHLFKILTDMDKNNTSRNLQKLIDTLSTSIEKLNTGYFQTVSIYSSYIVDPVLWMWLSVDKCDIVSDDTFTALIIRNYNKVL